MPRVDSLAQWLEHWTWVNLFVWFEVLGPSQQLWSCRDGQFTYPHFFPGWLTSTSCTMRAVKALARLCGCASLSEPSLVTCARGTLISWTGSFHWQPNVKHNAEACKNQFISWFVRMQVRVMIRWNQFSLLARKQNTVSWGRLARLISVVCSSLWIRSDIHVLSRLLRACFGELRKPSNLYIIYIRIFKDICY